MEMVWQKVSFFPIIKFADKTIFNFHSFNKINDFLTTQYSNTAYYLFCLYPLSLANENGMDKAQLSASLIRKK